MKKLLLLFALIVSSCSSFKSGLTIPANETFILGESNLKNYSAELLNISNYEVKIRGEKKDAFLEAGNGFGKIFDFWFPMRIDFIFTDESTAINDFFVIDQKLSDHYPIVTTISLN